MAEDFDWEEPNAEPEEKLAHEQTGERPRADLPAGVVTGLAELPSNAHLDADALGQLLGRCKKTIERSVRRGELPPPVKFMGRNVWLVGTILEHMETRQDAAVKLAKRRDKARERHRP